MRTTTRLGFDQLDRRDMPAVTLVGGVLTIDGTDYRDEVTVGPSPIPGRIQVRFATIPPGSSTGLGVVTPYPASQVQKIVFYGRGGDDYLYNNTSIQSEAYGQAGSDYIYGGSARDVIYGGTEADILTGGGGDDEIWGGGGADWLYGLAGWDTLMGGSNGDHLYGGTGLDRLEGGSGSDYLDGGNDGLGDTLFGGNPEGDTFVVEKYWLGIGWANRDEPQDGTDPTDVFLW